MSEQRSESVAVNGENKDTNENDTRTRRGESHRFVFSMFNYS